MNCITNTLKFLIKWQTWLFWGKNYATSYSIPLFNNTIYYHTLGTASNYVWIHAAFNLDHISPPCPRGCHAPHSSVIWTLPMFWLACELSVICKGAIPQRSLMQKQVLIRVLPKYLVILENIRDDFSEQ